MNCKTCPANDEHETKFVLNNSAAHTFVQWLACRCLPDPDFPTGIISSIYYDTQDWQFLQEKYNSDYLKTKVRVRWYADIDSEQPETVSYLEAKYKIGAKRDKVRIKIDVSGHWLSSVSLDDQALLEIPRRLWSENVEIPGHLYPTLQINYKRQRFIEPLTGTRLNVDYDIWVPDVNRQMLPYTYSVAP